MRVKLIIAAVVLIFLSGVLVITWVACEWPPPGLLLKYGPLPAGGPTGQVMTKAGIRFIELGPGYLRIGSDFGSLGRDRIARIFRPLGIPLGGPLFPGAYYPPHWHTIPQGFWIAETEVTNAQYERFDPLHPRHPLSNHDDSPVVDVSWDQASAFCKWLSGQTGHLVTLPSQNDWEYACRAGRPNGELNFERPPGTSDYSWFRENSGGRAHPVGKATPSDWGLHDMCGNAAEWCQDFLPGRSKPGPPSVGELAYDQRRVRGGCFQWSSQSDYLRERHFCARTASVEWLGFRPILRPR